MTVVASPNEPSIVTIDPDDYRLVTIELRATEVITITQGSVESPVIT